VRSVTLKPGPHRVRVTQPTLKALAEPAAVGGADQPVLPIRAAVLVADNAQGVGQATRQQIAQPKVQDVIIAARWPDPVEASGDIVTARGLTEIAGAGSTAGSQSRVPAKDADHSSAQAALTALRHACKLGLEGIVSKRSDLPYRSGRGEQWLKIKCVSAQELVILGYVPSTSASGVAYGRGASARPRWGALCSSSGGLPEAALSATAMHGTICPACSIERAIRSTARGSTRRAPAKRSSRRCRSRSGHRMSMPSSAARERQRDRRAARFAKMDASMPDPAVPSGTYRLASRLRAQYASSTPASPTLAHVVPDWIVVAAYVMLPGAKIR